MLFGEITVYFSLRITGNKEYDSRAKYRAFYVKANDTYNNHSGLTG
jgi:hypothetical protein